MQAPFLLDLGQVYGDPEEHPQRETYWGNVNPMGPRACYDEGKRVSETMMYAYNGQVIGFIISIPVLGVYLL